MHESSRIIFANATSNKGLVWARFLANWLPIDPVTESILHGTHDKRWMEPWRNTNEHDWPWNESHQHEHTITEEHDMEFRAMENGAWIDMNRWFTCWFSDIFHGFFFVSHSEVPYDAIVAILLGFASAVVDNVPLVAAAQGMSPGRFLSRCALCFWRRHGASESTDKNCSLIWHCLGYIYIYNYILYIYIMFLASWYHGMSHGFQRIFSYLWMGNTSAQVWARCASCTWGFIAWWPHPMLSHCAIDTVSHVFEDDGDLYEN